MCECTDKWDFGPVLKHDHVVPWRDSNETETAGKVMSKILKKQFDRDCRKSKMTKKSMKVIEDSGGDEALKLQPDEIRWKEVSNQKGISTICNNIFELMRPLHVAGIHNFHRAFGPELLHILRLGAMKNTIGAVVSLISIYKNLEDYMVQPPRKAMYTYSISTLDRRLKAAPIRRAMQTFFPVRQTTFRKSMSSMIHSKATDKSNSAYFAGSLYAWEYDMLVLNILFVLAADEDGDILPRPNRNDTDSIPGTKYRKGDIVLNCVGTLSSLTEVMFYSQADEFSSLDLDCYSKLIANFRMNDYKLLQMKQDLNALIDALKERKSRGDCLQGLQGGDICLDLQEFTNGEAKPHLLQHTPDEIREMSGKRNVRDTELLEHFGGHN